MVKKEERKMTVGIKQMINVKGRRKKRRKKVTK